MILTKDELAHKKVIFLLQSSLLKNVMTVKIKHSAGCWPTYITYSSVR